MFECGIRPIGPRGLTGRVSKDQMTMLTKHLRKILFLIVLLSAISVPAQQHPARENYGSDGRKTSLRLHRVGQ